MKIKFLNAIALFSLAIVAIFFMPHSATAQERVPMETDEAQMNREKMNWADYNQDVNTRYTKVMDQVERMKQKMIEMKMNNPDFRKSLAKFEDHATALHTRMQQAGSIPTDKQAKYRKKMRADLTKLNKEYDKLLEHWQKMNA